MKNSKILSSLFMILMLLTITLSSNAADEVVLNPGTISGSVSLTGYEITSVTVHAIDTNKIYSATVTVGAPAGATSIDYTLTVEGDNDYYVKADVYVSSAVSNRALIPPTGPVAVAIGADVPLNLSMEPAIISGTISTGNIANTITSYRVYAYLTLTQFDQPGAHYSVTQASSLSVSGDVGTDYTLFVAPETAYTRVWAYIGIDGLNYNVYDYGVTSPAAAGVLDRDYFFDISAATISGYALLNEISGIDVFSASVYGFAGSPSRNATAAIPDVDTGVYSLPVDAGSWQLYPRFWFTLAGVDPDFAGLTGSLYLPYTPIIDVIAGDDLTRNFDVNPGLIPGTINLWGANTNFYNAQVRAYGYPGGGYSFSPVDPVTGKFMFVSSPGNWQADNYQFLAFDYPDDPDTSLFSTVSRNYYSNAILETAVAGQTNEPIELSYGTITVRRYFYVAGDGILSSPYIKATRSTSPSSTAWGYGSTSPTTEGQAIVTLLLPGDYSLEAFATVDDSVAEFGTINITVDEGDVVVIGGTARPTIIVTNPTSGETICGNKVIVEGTATDDVGVASITINGQSVSFQSTGNPNDSNEVSFSHEVTLTLDQPNTITVTVADTDGTDPVVLSITVNSESCGPVDLDIALDIKPGSCPNPLNVKSKGMFPVAILGTAELDVTTVDLDSVNILGVQPVRSDFEDVATPFYPFYTGKQDKLDCTDAGADGYTDLTLKFDRQQLIQGLESSAYPITDGEVIVLPLAGKLLSEFGGNLINGEDVIVILNKGK